MALRFRKGDIILFACATLAAGVFAIINTFSGGAADSVRINADGALWREVPLLSDSRLEFNEAGRYNAIVIENASVRVEDANCPDKLCVKQGAISDPRTVIVCLPNKLSIRLAKTAPGGAEVDVIVSNQ